MYRELMVEAPRATRDDALKFFLQLAVECQWQGEGCNRMIVFVHRIFIEFGWWEEYEAESNPL
jgi:hypothetical protein